MNLLLTTCTDDKIGMRTRKSSSEEDHPYVTRHYILMVSDTTSRYYAGLGAVSDFADSLILFAYQRQCAVDKINAPYYLTCLEDLARGRDSETLQMEVATLASQGLPKRSEVDMAYRNIGIEPAHGYSLSNEFIINQFRSRLPDIAPKARDDLRRYLRVIGVARDCDAMQREASESIDTYEEALSWLDLDHNQPDDFVRTMFTIKVGTALIYHPSFTFLLILHRPKTILCA